MPVQASDPTEKRVMGPARTPAVAPRALSPGSLLASRYQIEAALGQGGMGVVYRARDQKADRVVAIKAFYPPVGLEEGPRRFQREFRALTRLRHPRIVRVFDYGETGGVPFYVMEFIAGIDLSGLRRAHGGRLPIRDVTAIGLQLCEALAYIHAQGIVHRDLKPSNVMLASGHAAATTQTPNGNFQIKIVDFGLAKFADVSANLTESGVMLGTINYMSPEQGQALPIDSRSDLYSLGVILYELAAGQLPFTADTPIAILFQHITQSPPFLRSVDPSISPEFEALVLSLLAKRPNDRPPSAEALLHALAGLTSLGAPAPTEIVAAPRADAVFRAGLIGRQAELARLSAYLDQAWAGEGRMIIIEGEAGVGKTRLAAEIAGQARLRGGMRLRGTCHETERVPYGPVAEWLDDAFRLSENFGEIVAGFEPELARLIPRLIPPGSPAADGDLDAQHAKLRFFDAVMRVLARLSERKPLLLLLDDMQWADEATLELLHYLTRNTRGQRIFICATARREDRDESSPLAALLRDLSRQRLVERIGLERLSPQATSDLIAALLGLGESPHGLAERIYTESEGNPFFVEEILKALAEEGLLVRRGGRWRLEADAGLTMLRIPATIVDVIERRLSHLADADRDALNWAAVLGYEFTYDILWPATGREEDALLDALDSLLHGQLLAEVRDPRQDKYRFTHAKIREVVYTSLSSARRKRMHRSAGEAIERVHAARLEEMSPILAHHFAEGGDVPKAVRYGIQAGDRARKVYANQEAIAFYRQAIELIGGISDADLQILLVEHLIAAHRGLGEVYHLIGEYEPAAASFRAVSDLVSRTNRDEAERRRLLAEAWRGLGQTRERIGEYAEALRCYDQGLSNLDASESEERARLLNAMAAVYIHQGKYEQVRSHCEQAIRSARDISDIVATAYGYLGVTAKFQDDYDRAVDYHLKALALWEKVNDKSQVAKELNNLGMLAEENNVYDEAVDYYQKSLALCQEVGHSLGTASLLNNLGVIHQDRGQLEQARDYFQQSLGIYQRIGSKDGVAIAYSNLAEICIARGKTDEAMNYLIQAESITEELGDKLGLAYTWMLMAEVRLAERWLDEAQNYALRALKMADESGMKLYAGKANRLLGRIYQQAGRIQEARHHLTEACEIFKAIGKQVELEGALDMLRHIGDNGEVA